MNSSINSLKKLNIGIFTSASVKLDHQYTTLAKNTGRILAENGHSIVYGGAQIGMMGAVAEGALESNGHVIGVFPENLGSREIAHQKLSELIITNGLHERKKIIYEKSDFFIALPGGFGTLDETFEVLTWNQLGHFQKNLYFFNYNHFFDHLIEFITHLEKEKFIKVYDQVGIKSITHSNQLISLFQTELKIKYAI